MSAHVYSPNFCDKINVKDFGAKGDGSPDDKLVVQAALDLAQAKGVPAYFPAGIYNATPNLYTSGACIVGDGPYQTVFQDDAETGDILYAGNATPIINLFLSGFRVASLTQKTDGAGVHLENVGRSALLNVTADGQDGNGNLWHGFWFDRVGFVTHDRFEARAQQDGLRVNGSANGTGPIADLYCSNYKIALSGNGVHIGGGFGGAQFGIGAIIANNVNVRISQDIAARSNRAVLFGEQCSIDAGTNQNVIINDPGTTGIQQYFQFEGGWNAGAGSHAIDVQSCSAEARLSVAGRYWNNGGDALRISSLLHLITKGLNTQTNGGWGINPTIALPGSRVTLSRADNLVGDANGAINWANLGVPPGTIIPFEPIADDGVFSFAPQRNTGRIYIEDVGDNRYAEFRYNCGSAPSLTSFHQNGPVDLVTGSLTGTTGQNGRQTISAHSDGRIYIENRIGGTQNFRIVVD